MPNPCHLVHTLHDRDTVVRWHLLLCPGCDTLHAPRSRLPATSPDYPGPLWTWDGNVDAPTFDPSLLVHLDGKDGSRKCHSYIRAGSWDFLADSTAHQLRGLVPLPPLPDWAADPP